MATSTRIRRFRRTGRIRADLGSASPALRCSSVAISTDTATSCPRRGPSVRDAIVFALAMAWNLPRLNLPARARLPWLSHARAPSPGIGGFRRSVRPCRSRGSGIPFGTARPMWSASEPRASFSIFRSCPAKSRRTRSCTAATIIWTSSRRGTKGAATSSGSSTCTGPSRCPRSGLRPAMGALAAYLHTRKTMNSRPSCASTASVRAGSTAVSRRRGIRLIRHTKSASNAGRAKRTTC